MENFGEFIRGLRKDKGLTLTELAAKLKMDSANLSKIENNIRELDERKIPLLAEVFGLNEAELNAELLSEKIAKRIFNLNNHSEVLRLIEKKILIFRDKNMKQISMNF